ncbi:hypothetical protein GW17_00055525 [Ensete ventricosum]|nr:hypothetical protein GW17_00055525 [Ensete ventricosum]
MFTSMLAAIKVVGSERLLLRFCRKRLLLAAIKGDGSERSLLAALCNGSEGSLLVAFVLQRIAAGCDQGGWQREIAACSIVQREMRAAVEGIREIGWLKDWWTEG